MMQQNSNVQQDAAGSPRGAESTDIGEGAAETTGGMADAELDSVSGGACANGAHIKADLLLNKPIVVNKPIVGMKAGDM